MNPLSESIDLLGLASVWTYLALFLAASLIMLWRLEALLAHGLEGTALGTLLLPYCSGLGNLLFIGVVASRDIPGEEILINCLVNNVTNLTLLLGLPALCWGLALASKKSGDRGGARKKTGAETERQLTRLSLFLTLAAVLFFSGVTWALGSDGTLDSQDGLALVGLFLFWQCFQVFDVLKHNVRRRQSFGPLFYLDMFIVLLGGGVLYASIDWLVAWLAAQKSGFLNVEHLGWLSGWLMVLPNALLAFYYAARRRADIVYASQIGDGHICIPLCLGLAALIAPLKVPAFFATGLVIIAAATTLHAVCLAFASGLPRWMGWPLLAGYAWFIAAGFW